MRCRTVPVLGSARSGLFLLLLLLIWVPSVFGGCESDCNCTQTAQSVRCHCVSTDFLCAVAHLNNDTTHLNFTASADGSHDVHLELASLRRFHRLKELIIAVPVPYLEGKDICNLYGLNYPETFAGLAELKTLRLNVYANAPTTQLIFAPLASLEELDLSFAQDLTFSRIAETFRKMTTKRLKRLRLRSTQSEGVFNAGVDSMSLNLTSFLEPFEEMPLEVVDVSRNALTHISPGILRHHSLKQVYFHENFLHRVFAFYVEVLIHPTLKIAVGDYNGCPAMPGYKPMFYRDWIKLLAGESAPMSLLSSMKIIAQNPHSMGQSEVVGSVSNSKVFSQVDTNVPSGNSWSATVSLRPDPRESSSMATSDRHDLYVFVCKIIEKIFKWLEELSCADIPYFSITHLFVGRPCIYGIQFPLGPNLTEFHLAHYANHAGIFLTTEGTYCFNPNNSIKLVDLSNMGKLGRMFSVDNLQFTGLKKLEVLNVENSQLDISKLTILSNLPRLRVFSNRGNRLHVDNDTDAQFFSRNPQLQELILSDNGLSRIPQEEFSHLTKLRILDLSQNEIKNTSFALPTSGNLRLLRLNDNDIQTLSIQTRTELEQISARNDGKLEVDLSDNRLSCGCDDLDFVRWLQDTRHRVHFTKVEAYQCQSVHTGGDLITKVNVKKLHAFCNPSYVKVICASALSTLGAAILLAVAFTLHRKRYIIMHWIYTKLTRPKLIHDDVTPYKYDAFITYSTEDKWWVHHTLLAEMEEKRGLKLCISLRDFPGGGLYADIIDDAMNESRKTVLVLSPNFLKSQWCHHEMNMAHNRLVADGVDLVELVILSPLSSAVMTNVLTQLMQQKRHIVWVEDPTGQQLFWDQLQDMLRSPRSYPNLY